VGKLAPIGVLTTKPPTSIGGGSSHNDNVSLQSIKITSLNENRLISNYRVRQKILSINFNILSDKILFFDENENLIFTFNTNSDIEYLVLTSKDTMDNILTIKLFEL